MRGKRRLSTLADINVTNLVDVTLVLLIIFILVAPFIRMGVNVQSPKISDPDPLSSDKSIMVKINKDEKIFLDNKPIVLEDLGPSVAEALKIMPDAPVLIDGDERIPYGVTMQVIDQIRQAGIQSISLVTRKSSSEKNPPTSQ